MSIHRKIPSLAVEALPSPTMWFTALYGALKCGEDTMAISRLLSIQRPNIANGTAVDVTDSMMIRGDMTTTVEYRLETIS